MTSAHQQSISQFIKELDSEQLPIKKIYLYGSYSRGEEHEWSDIDLGVVTEPFAEDSFAETVHLQKIAHRINPILSPVSLRPEDMDNRFCSLAQTIQREGQLIE